MNSDIKNLILEFESENQSSKEAEKLAYFAKNLSNSIKIERSQNIKIKFLRNISRNIDNKSFLKKHIFASLFAIVLMLGTVTLASAKVSLPGQPLYPVKRVVENIISNINPSYKSNFLKTRSEEIKDISGKSDNRVFKKAVSDYEQELNSALPVNTENLEVSKNNLQEAIQRESLRENKQILEDAIIKTDDRKKEINSEDVKSFRSEYNNDIEENSQND